MNDVEFRGLIDEGLLSQDWMTRRSEGRVGPINGRRIEDYVEGDRGLPFSEELFSCRTKSQLNRYHVDEFSRQAVQIVE